MRIRGFSWNLMNDELEHCILKNCTVVIDGHNFFYNVYKESGLPFQFGCECNKYADYIREYLEMFKKANIKCLFIFKGGHGKTEKKSSEPNQAKYEEFVLPVFTKFIYKDVLDEMNFDYVICEFESKQQCIAAAQKLKCPIISLDIEFCFSGVPYIPHITLKYNNSNQIECGIFRLKTLLTKYNLTKEKMSTFIILTDETIFPKDSFNDLFVNLKLSQNVYARNAQLLRWLSRTSDNQISVIKNKSFMSIDKTKFDEEIKRINSFICKKECPGIPVEYLTNGKHIDFHEKDPLWFEKGVAMRQIPIPYINLYHYGYYSGSWCMQDENADDAMILSLDIIKYAFNLLNNYKEKEFTFYTYNDECQKIDVTDAGSVQKPSLLINVINSPFENGWNNLDFSELFNYFVKKTIATFNFASIETLPANAKLLLIALAYFSRQKNVDVLCEVYSILLSYIMIEIADTTWMKKEECDEANAAMSEFFTVAKSEISDIFDKELLHPLIEFQHCLDNFNLLNQLCGSPYSPTKYSRTYNGTFVYKMLYTFKHTNSGNPLNYILAKLSLAPSALNYFHDFINVYNQLVD